MSEVSLRRRESSEQRRSAILHAARTVFARKGYESTVVEDIAGEAGIGKGTLYLYFPSKEQIYLAALIADARMLDQETRRAILAASSWQEALRAYVEVRLRYFDLHQDFVRIYMTEFRGICLQGRAASAELLLLAEASDGQLAQRFAEAEERRQMRPVDSQQAALMVADITRGLMERRLRGNAMGQADAEFAIETMCRAWSE
ncbi:MAG TPA: helix-turn-helix domain-containing protein [Candidatus Acidoferrum sp.]|nr:helix-turn-helix domain-containing protein [Candidatus Acidoferrum sp.]